MIVSQKELTEKEKDFCDTGFNELPQPDELEKNKGDEISLCQPCFDMLSTWMSCVTSENSENSFNTSTRRTTWVHVRRLGQCNKQKR